MPFGLINDFLPLQKKPRREIWKFSPDSPPFSLPQDCLSKLLLILMGNVLQIACKKAQRAKND
jgi:hypothetical protein